jgi:hypothetical protein
MPAEAEAEAIPLGAYFADDAGAPRRREEGGRT